MVWGRFLARNGEQAVKVQTPEAQFTIHLRADLAVQRQKNEVGQRETI